MIVAQKLAGCNKLFGFDRFMRSPTGLRDMATTSEAC